MIVMVMSNMLVMVDEDGDGGNVDGHKQGDGELTKLAPWPPKQLSQHLG